MKVNSAIKKALGVALVAGAMMLGTAAKSEASFIAYICQNALCSGGTVVSAIDDGVGDTGGAGILGYINFTGVVGGLTIVTNVSQSKPLIGSAGSPQMDILFSATGAGTAYIYARDTSFTGLTALHGSADGNFTTGTSCVTASIYTDTTNSSTLPFTSQNSATGAQSCANPFHAAVSIAAAGSSPYALMLGVQVVRTGSGTTTGDYKVIPEPAALGLLGLGLLGLGYVSRRRRQ